MKNQLKILSILALLTILIPLATALTYTFHSSNQTSGNVAANNQNQKILCLGDSITHGAYLSNPYPNTLQSLTGTQVTNGGIDGNTVSMMLSRWNSDYKTQGYTTLVLLGGVNDLTNVDLSITENNLRTIWQSALNQGCKVYAVTLLPFGLLIPQILELNNWIRTTAPSMGVHVVDVYYLMQDSNQPGYLNPIYSYDGLHPSQAGADLIAQTVAKLF